jgi:hypothetical protein
MTYFPLIIGVLALLLVFAGVWWYMSESDDRLKLPVDPPVVGDPQPTLPVDPPVTGDPSLPGPLPVDPPVVGDPHVTILPEKLHMSTEEALNFITHSHDNGISLRYRENAAHFYSPIDRHTLSFKIVERNPSTNIIFLAVQDVNGQLTGQEVLVFDRP